MPLRQWEKNLKSVAVEMEDLIETESNSTDLRVW